jgi:hypothetical protein
MPTSHFYLTNRAKFAQCSSHQTVAELDVCRAGAQSGSSRWQPGKVQPAMAENVDNSLMLETLKEIRKDQQEMRKEQRDQRTLLLLTADTVRKLHLYTEKKFLDLEERMRAHRDDLELMLKAELLGSLTNFQIRIETYVDRRLGDRTV